MGRHAYLLLAHKNFNQLKRLVELLDDPRNDIFVHVDGKAKDFDEREFEGLARFSRLKFTDRRLRLNWGGESIIKAEILLLKEAASIGKYDYYHLLSGQDLPLKSQDKIHDFFDRNAGKEFLNLWPMEEHTTRRFRYYYLFPEGEHFPHTRILNRVGIKLQKLFKCNKNSGIEFGYSSQWFSITDDFARYIIEKEEWIKSVFDHTVICDEIFVPTLLLNSPYKDNLYNKEVRSQTDSLQGNLRLIDWSRSESSRHPGTFRVGDYETIVSSPCFWGRKFDEEVDSEIIDKVYNNLKDKN